MSIDFLSMLEEVTQCLIGRAERPDVASLRRAGRRRCCPDTSRRSAPRHLHHHGRCHHRHLLRLMNIDPRENTIKFSSYESEHESQPPQYHSIESCDRTACTADLSPTTLLLTCMARYDRKAKMQQNNVVMKENCSRLYFLPYPFIYSPLQLLLIHQVLLPTSTFFPPKISATTEQIMTFNLAM